MEKMEEMICKMSGVRTTKLSVEHKTKYRKQYIKDDIFQFKEGIWWEVPRIKSRRNLSLSE